MTLLEKALSAELPKVPTIRTAYLVKPVSALRDKGWRWIEIYQWLKQEGEAVHKTPACFASAMSRALKTWRAKQK